MSKKVVVIGGGTGSSNLIGSIKDLDIDLYVITTVFDSGGSTGILRQEFNIPAIGDIRQVLVSLADDKLFWNKLMNYRFSKISSLDPHSLGNLIITSLIDIKHDFYDAIKSLSDIFNIKGEIIPITNNPNIQMKAIYDDDSIQEYEHLIPTIYKKIKAISFNKLDFDVNKRAIKILSEADYIIFSSGSLYTSIIVNIAIEKIRNEIINNRKAKLIYLSNLVTQNGETDNMSILDHVLEIEKNLDNKRLIDFIIANNKIDCNQELVNRYKENKQDFLLVNDDLINDNKKRKIIQDSLIDKSNIINIRHDKKNLNKLFKKILK